MFFVPLESTIGGLRFNDFSPTAIADFVYSSCGVAVTMAVTMEVMAVEVENRGAETNKNSK